MKQYAKQNIVRLLFVPLIAALATNDPGRMLAATTQTFDGGGTTYAASNHNGIPAPGITAGGPAGNFFRLTLRTNECDGSDNSLTFDRTDAGVFPRVMADFDFRFRNLTPTNFGYGDGFGFVLLRTDEGGINGPPVLDNFTNAFEFENPEMSGTLAIGFDSFEDSKIFIYWDGQKIAEARATNGFGVSYLREPQFHRAHVEVDFVAQTVSVAIRQDVYGSNVLNTIYQAQPVPGLEPYESRALFGARTGCAQQDTDLDNVSVTWTQNVASVKVPTSQNFDSAGTPYYATNYNLALPPGILAGGPTGNYFQLTTNAGGSEAVLAFDQTTTGACTRVVANFDFRLSQAGEFGTGDGFSFILIPTNPFGTNGAPQPEIRSFDTSPTWFTQEEPNLYGAFALGFDTYSGGELGEADGSHVSIHWDGSLVQALSPGFDIYNEDWNRVHLEVDFRRGTATLLITESVFTNPITHVVFADVCVPGLSAYENRVYFGARTGAATQNCDLDNIAVTWADAVSLIARDTSHDFNNGTSYTEINYGGTNAPGLTNADAPVDNVYDFADTSVQIGAGTNAIAFNRTHTGAADYIRFGFNFRIGNADTNDPTRALCLALLPTGEVGASGDPYPGGLPVDDLATPDFAGAFAISIRPQPTEDDDDAIILYWDGNEIMGGQGLFGLADGRIHRIEGALDCIEETVTVKLITDYYGSFPGENLIAENEPVSGLTPYESRLFIGAATGNSTDTCGVDNPFALYTPRARPVLASTPENGLCRLGWSLFDTGFAVEETPALSPSDWVGLTTTPSVTNNESYLLLPPTNSAAFFRLRKL